MRAASYSEGAVANPRPASNSRRSSVRIDCDSDRLPLVSSTNTRLARLHERVHLSRGVDLVIPRICARIGSHDQSMLGHNAQTVSHRTANPFKSIR